MNQLKGMCKKVDLQYLQYEESNEYNGGIITAIAT